MTTKTNIEKTQAAFIAYVEKEGLIRALEWIGAWYDRAAVAAIEDELVNNYAERAKDPEIRELHLTQYLFSTASRVSNTSTSVGHNLMEVAKVSALASWLQQSGEVRRNRDARWDAVRTAYQASDSPAPPATPEACKPL